MAHTLNSNNSILSDFDVHGPHLVTCGQSVRHGGVTQPDRFLMIYDLRASISTVLRSSVLIASSTNNNNNIVCRSSER